MEVFCLYSIDNITELRYNLFMNFRQLLINKNVSGYALSKKTGIPYATISDLLNGKTKIDNISFKNAVVIADSLNMDIKDLLLLDDVELIEMRYFRNNVLQDYKRKGFASFLKNIFSSKEIDFYYKNNGLSHALYLLALVDYLCRINNQPINTKRYNELRTKKLDKPLFIGSDLITFSSIEEAEKKLGIEVIPEFKKYNIIEEDVFNVA